MANSLNTITVDGVTQTMESYQASQTQANKDNSALGKDAFLQLLVTQMKYQDPMEPSDNSQYVEQLSNFTQVETLSSVQDEVEQMSAKTLVGKYVSITDEDNGIVYEGKVDYVTTQSGTMYVSVDGVLHKVSEVTSIADSNYFEETTLAQNVETLINNLPTAGKLTLSDADSVHNVAEAYDSLSTTAKQYVSQTAVDKLTELAVKLNGLIAAQNEIDAKKTAASDSGESSSQSPENAASETAAASAVADEDAKDDASLAGTEDTEDVIPVTEG